VPADARAEVRGYRELQAGSVALFRRIGPAAEARFRDVGDQVATTARGRVPHRSGQLAGSVSVDTGEDGAVVVGIGSGRAGAYAGWVEFGGTRGRPYVAPGRYFYPVARHAEPQLVLAARIAAEAEIRETLWPRPML
jgi:phage gpG-like protein